MNPAVNIYLDQLWSSAAAQFGPQEDVSLSCNSNSMQESNVLSKAPRIAPSQPEALSFEAERRLLEDEIAAAWKRIGFLPSYQAKDLRQLPPDDLRVQLAQEEERLKEAQLRLQQAVKSSEPSSQPAETLNDADSEQTRYPREQDLVNSSYNNRSEPNKDVSPGPTIPHQFTSADKSSEALSHVLEGAFSSKGCIADDTHDHEAQRLEDGSNAEADRSGKAVRSENCLVSECAEDQSSLEWTMAIVSHHRPSTNEQANLERHTEQTKTFGSSNDGFGASFHVPSTLRAASELFDVCIQSSAATAEVPPPLLNASTAPQKQPVEPSSIEFPPVNQHESTCSDPPLMRPIPNAEAAGALRSLQKQCRKRMHAEYKDTQRISDDHTQQHASANSANVHNLESLSTTDPDLHSKLQAPEESLPLDDPAAGAVEATADAVHRPRPPPKRSASLQPRHPRTAVMVSATRNNRRRTVDRIDVSQHFLMTIDATMDKITSTSTMTSSKPPRRAAAELERLKSLHNSEEPQQPRPNRVDSKPSSSLSHWRTSSTFGEARRNLQKRLNGTSVSSHSQVDDADDEALPTRRTASPLRHSVRNAAASVAVNLLDLPDDVLLHILAFLDKRSRQAAADTCQRLCRLLQHPKLNRRLSFAGRSIDAKIATAFEDRRPKELVLARCKLPSSFRITSRVGHCLKTLHLECCINSAWKPLVKSFVAHCSQLEELNLSWNKSIDDELLHLLKDLKSTHLRVLLLDGCSSFSSDSLAALFTYASMSRLERLSLASCATVDEVALSSLFAQTHLKKLNLSGCRKVSPISLRQLPITLCDLRLDSCSQLSRIAIPALVHLQALEVAHAISVWPTSTLTNAFLS
eukprot:TRINITY_DN11637_c0_g2_i1.p1 TRINITY_DN11637_c0_g2~~TRINITY_DN11637_c0_g2_i1.p1  ORF type:complete len:862 (+),score=92.80 TRINITY_DN11637_c0_g2_i1:44-2629(+)